MHIGILGGTFDPPHEGHVYISLSALSKMKLDEVWWVVTSKNPFKSNCSKFEKRFAKAKGFVNKKNVKVVFIEKEYSAFTIDTVIYLKKKYPHLNFVWLMGSDNLYNFHRWKRWKEIFCNIPIAIFNRPFYSFILTKFRSLVYFRRARVKSSLIEKIKYLVPPAWIFINILPNVKSSSDIRNKTTND